MSSQRTTLAMLAYDDCNATSVTGPIDILSLVNTLWHRENDGAHGSLFDWRILSPDGKPVRTYTGIRLEVDGTWREAKGCGLVVVPAVHYQRASDLIKRLEQLRPWLAWLPTLNDGDTHIAAKCTGTFLLAESGLLDGRKSTSSWWLKNLFEHRYPKVELTIDDLVVSQGNIHTAGAYNAYVDLMLRLVERFAGRDLSLLAAKIMLADANRTSQAAYSTLQDHMGHADSLVSQAQSWMQARLREELDLERVADAVGVSPRTLIRRFKQAVGETPTRYLQQLRIDAAKRLLESTGLNLDAITERIGYLDTSTFRKLFKKHTGLSPGAYREKFGITRQPAVESEA